MKSKLGIFFAGFGAGLLVMFVLLGFVPSDRPAARRDTWRLVFEMGTNSNDVAQMKQVLRSESGPGRAPSAR